MSDRRFGSCREATVPAQVPSAVTQPAYVENGPAIMQGFVQNIPVYGRWYGGISCRRGLGIRFRGCRCNSE